MIIDVRELRKTFITYERGEHFRDVLKSLVKRKQVEIKAVDGISFQLDEGELVGFLGPNGAGKSTTLKVLTGILHPTSGEVNIMGFVPWKQRRQYVGNIGAVFGQKSQLILDIPPLDAFMMNRAIYQVPKADFKRRLDLMVELLEVGNQIHQPTRGLSLGERMKCEFIMAMLHAPKIVFLDEPTIGLDVIAKEKIRGFIREMNAAGTTFILTTHDLQDIEELAKRVIVINHGEIVFNDSLEALKNNMGQKRIIRMKTLGPIDDHLPLGMTLLERVSSSEASFELDTNVLPLESFISGLGARGGRGFIQDISISEPPIEEIIKEIYTRKSG